MHDNEPQSAAHLEILANIEEVGAPSHYDEDHPLICTAPEGS